MTTIVHHTLFRTDSHKIIYPVQDREAIWKHTVMYTPISTNVVAFKATSVKPRPKWMLVLCWQIIEIRRIFYGTKCDTQTNMWKCSHFVISPHRNNCDLNNCQRHNQHSLWSWLDACCFERDNVIWNRCIRIKIGIVTMIFMYQIWQYLYIIIFSIFYSKTYLVFLRTHLWWWYKLCFLL